MFSVIRVCRASHIFMADASTACACDHVLCAWSQIPSPRSASPAWMDNSGRSPASATECCKLWRRGTSCCRFPHARDNGKISRRHRICSPVADSCVVQKQLIMRRPSGTHSRSCRWSTERNWRRRCRVAKNVDVGLRPF